MENQPPFDLDEAIRRWQQNLGKSPVFRADNLEELASHLRASVQSLKAKGLSEEAAFLMAVQQIGERGPLEKEFAKMRPAATWTWPGFLFCVVSGIFIQRAFSGWEDVKDMIVWVWPTCHSSLDWIFDWQGGYGTAIFLAVWSALLCCWRLGTGGWNGFVAFLVGRFQERARARPIRTTVLVLLFSLSPFVPECLAIVMKPSFFHTPLLNSIDWFAFATYAAINVILILTMVFLARRKLHMSLATNSATLGFGSLHEADGPIHPSGR